MAHMLVTFFVLGWSMLAAGVEVDGTNRDSAKNCIKLLVAKELENTVYSHLVVNASRSSGGWIVFKAHDPSNPKVGYEGDLRAVFSHNNGKTICEAVKTDNSNPRIYFELRIVLLQKGSPHGQNQSLKVSP